MRNKGLILIGAAMILIGLTSLIGTVLDVDAGGLLWAVGLILLGVWLLLRPQLFRSETAPRVRIFGPIRRKGAWQVADEELWVLIGDVILDFTNAEIPVGETEIRTYGFVGEIKVSVPEGVGVSLSSTAFVTDARVLGQRREVFLAPAELASEGYETAERKIRLETTCFVADVRVKRA
jgi:predicted membrane protein